MIPSINQSKYNVTKTIQSVVKFVFVISSEDWDSANSINTTKHNEWFYSFVTQREVIVSMNMMSVF